jgi:DNA polymerase-3 subunit epsilon
MEKLFFYDLETTGVKFWKNGIHQISGCIVIDGEVKESFDFKVCPYASAEIEDDALLVGGVTKEQILSYPEMKVVYEKIIAMLSKYVDKYDKTDKFHLVGYNNSSFDNQFFRAFFVQNFDNYFGSWFWSDSIDVMVLASNKLKSERKNMINFKQITVAKYLGIDVDETNIHNAEYDISICRKIYDKVK